MPSLEEAMRQSEDSIEQLDDDGLITPVNDVFMINPETRVIEVPESERLFGVNFDKDVEKKYFKCPKIVGNNIDLSKHKIYVVYQKANENITTLMGEVGKYWCEDVKVDETGDYIEFSWLLSGNVLGEQGFIAFKVVAVYTDTEIGELKTRWNTVPSIGLVRFTLSDGEEITEQYADVITQLLQRMDAVEDIATPEAMKGYVEQYFNEHPMELDETLTDSKKAAPANLVGQLKGELNKSTPIVSYFFFPRKEPFIDTKNRTITFYANTPFVVNGKTYGNGKSTNTIINIPEYKRGSVAYYLLFLDLVESKVTELSFHLQDWTQRVGEKWACVGQINIENMFFSFPFNVNIDGTPYYALGKEVYPRLDVIKKCIYS